MFFQGSLQEGIAAAVQQQKRVICFVHDDTEQSSAWESDYLTPLAALLNDNAVVLKIALGSQEAGFLSAICPIQEAPVVVVISNGQVKEALRPPMEVDQFRRQLLSAMDLNFTISQPTGQASSSTLAQGSALAAASASSRPTDTSQTGAAGASVGETPTVDEDEEPAWVAHRRERMAELEGQRIKEQKQKQEAARQAAQVPGSRAAEVAKKNEELRKKRKQAADERQRILDNIEADKQERRKAAQSRAEERALEREHGKQSELDSTQDGSSNTLTKPDASAQAKAKASTKTSKKSTADTAVPEKARLQLRFSDGRVAKPEFASGDTLLSVRKWISSNGGAPEGKFYAFRQIVGVGSAPQFSSSEEQESLLRLGLAPSATLIIRAVPSPASAFSQAVLGILFRVWSLLLFMLSPVAALYKYLTGGPASSEPGARTMMDHDTIGRSSATDAKAAELQSLEERKRKGKPSLYNGNQTSVLPNDPPEDEDSK